VRMRVTAFIAEGPGTSPPPCRRAPEPRRLDGHTAWPGGESLVSFQLNRNAYEEIAGPDIRRIAGRTRRSSALWTARRLQVMSDCVFGEL
jgi:hypothetical protein